MGNPYGGVAGWTKLTTDSGEIEIRTLVGQEVNVWNGQVYSAVTPVSVKTKDTVIITFDNGKQLFCARNQLIKRSGADPVYAGDLFVGDVLSAWSTPNATSDVAAVVEITEGPSLEVYGFVEPLQGMCMVNGVMIPCLQQDPE